MDSMDSDGGPQPVPPAASTAAVTSNATAVCKGAAPAGGWCGAVKAAPPIAGAWHMLLACPS
jgi:hypothetical protein